MPDENNVANLWAELEKLPGVESIMVVEPHTATLFGFPGSSIIGARSPNKQLTPKPFVDEVTLASEASLAEAWLSPEDDHWDDFYKELCTKKAM